MSLTEVFVGILQRAGALRGDVVDQLVVVVVVALLVVVTRERGAKLVVVASAQDLVED